MSFKLQQIRPPGHLINRIPGMDCEAIPTAPAADQGRFLAWRHCVFGWGRKCVGGERFDRGHNTGIPCSQPGLTAEQQFILDLHSGLRLLDHGIKYHIVDFLLNKWLWGEASIILDFRAYTLSNLLRLNAPAQQPFLTFYFSMFFPSILALILLYTIP